MSPFHAPTQPYITELDLHRISLPTASIEFLQKHMPQFERYAGEEGEEDDGERDVRFDYTEFLDDLFT